MDRDKIIENLHRTARTSRNISLAGVEAMRLLTELDAWEPAARKKAVKWLRLVAEGKSASADGRIKVKAAELLLTTKIDSEECVRVIQDQDENT